jgi:hypothetical protein
MTLGANMQTKDQRVVSKFQDHIVVPTAATRWLRAHVPRDIWGMNEGNREEEGGDGERKWWLGVHGRPVGHQRNSPLQSALP